MIDFTYTWRLAGTIIDQFAARCDVDETGNVYDVQLRTADGEWIDPPDRLEQEMAQQFRSEYRDRYEEAWADARGLHKTYDTQDGWSAGR